MAYTKIKEIKSTVNKALDYIMNPEKTDKQLLVAGFNCDSFTASIEFEMTKALAAKVIGKKSSNGKNILAYHLIQSFSYRDKISPEEAMNIGREFADRLLGGKFEYVIATHIDKRQVHNHIIFNSTSYYDFKKYHNKYAWLDAWKISNELCIQKGLQIISYQEYDKRTYNANKFERYYGRKRVNSTKDLKNKIDKSIAMTKSYEEFKKRLLNLDGIIINDRKDSFTFKAPTMKNARSGSVIGEDYTKEAIIKRIESGLEFGKNITLADNIELQTRRTAKENLTKLTEAMNTIRSENINSYDDIPYKTSEIRALADSIRKKINELNTRSTHYKKIAGYLETCNRYQDLYNRYSSLKGRRKSKFFDENQQALEAYQVAKTMLENHNVNPDVVPEKVMNLVNEKSKLISELELDHKKALSRIDKIQKAKKIISDTPMRDVAKNRNKGKWIAK